MSTAFAGIGAAMQQLLIGWLLVGILLLPAHIVGIIQAAIAIPGIFLLLWGGAKADRSDPRFILFVGYLFAWTFPLALLAVAKTNLLTIWTVAIFGLLMSIATSFTSPAQQSLLTRVAAKNIQRGVTLVTGLGFLVQILGFSLAGQLETIGMTHVLVLQSTALLLTAITASAITPATTQISDKTKTSTLTHIAEGLSAATRNNIILNTLLITFISGIFNAGAFLTAIPFIVKRVYEGNAMSFAMVMAVFYTGAAISNLVQYWLMPLKNPGFWFLILQLSRILILFFVWIQPSWGWLLVVLFAWGLNMGVTTNLSRAIVQEASESEFLGRILSVYSIGLMGSIPIGALIIGYVIEAFGTMSAMLPGMFLSGIVFIYGYIFTNIPSYHSPDSG